MEALQAETLTRGTRVRVHDRHRTDHAFQGRTGEFLGVTRPAGYLRLHLDGEQPTMTVLVHPESIELE